MGGTILLLCENSEKNEISKGIGVKYNEQRGADTVDINTAAESVADPSAAVVMGFGLTPNSYPFSCIKFSLKK